MNKHKKHKYSHKPGGQNNKNAPPKTQRLTADQSSVYDSFSLKMGENYKLSKVLQISWPVYKVELEVTVESEPEDVLKEIHLMLLNIIKLGINTTDEIAAFLGLNANDFILDELYELRRNNLLKYYDDKYVVEAPGRDFLSKKGFIPVPEKRKYDFCVNGVSGAIERARDIKDAGHDYIKFPCDITQVGYNFIEENWTKICARFKTDFTKQELTGLSNGRQGIKSKLYFEERYLLVYIEKNAQNEGSAKIVLIDAYNKVELKDDQSALNAIVSKYSEILFKTLEDYEYTSVAPKDIHPLESKVKSIDGFLPINFREVDDYIRYALKEGQTVYLEVPRLLKKALKFKIEIEQFLKREGTKIYIVYGVSEDYEHDANTVKEFRVLRSVYQNLHFIDLPDHIYRNRLGFSGAHRRVIVKDHDFYIETSYNYFTLDFDKKQKVSIESATIFNKNVGEYFNAIFKQYKL